MTTEQFTWWLKGITDSSDGEGYTPEQFKLIKQNLALITNPATIPFVWEPNTGTGNPNPYGPFTTTALDCSSSGNASIDLTNWDFTCVN